MSSLLNSWLYRINAPFMFESFYIENNKNNPSTKSYAEKNKKYLDESITSTLIGIIKYQNRWTRYLIFKKIIS